MSNIAIADRKDWIGGTDVAALFGKSQRKTAFEVWHKKAGNLDFETDLGDRGEAGMFMEPAIADWARSKFDLKLRKVRRHIPHKSIERFGVSLDYETVQGHVPVEIKNVDSLVFRDQWQYEGDTITRTPIDYLLQCQSQLACTGKPYHHLVTCVGGNNLFHMTLERHEPTIAKIENEVAAFWQSVKEQRPPNPDWGADARSLSRLYRYGGGGFVDMSADEHLQQLIESYLETSETYKAADYSRSATKAEILTIIEDADRVKCGSFEISSSILKEQKVSFVRSSHRRLAITQKEEKNYD